MRVGNCLGLRLNDDHGQIRIDSRVVCLYHGFVGCNCNVLTATGAIDPITRSTGLKLALCNVGEV